jgi:broad specificity polyphosphatase/5'/3'-nucleotidase SurE
MAAQYSTDYLDEFRAMWKKNHFVNVNIPNNPAGPSGMTCTRPARKSYNDSISKKKGPAGEDLYFLNWGIETVEEDEASDCHAVMCNITSVSLIYSHPEANMQIQAEG